MPVTKEQAQILATLAVACRPHRAPTWDEAGVMAAIAGVRHMALPEVALAVIRAAADRDAITPGVIPKLGGSHWQEQLKPGLYEPNVWDPADVCTTCSLTRAACQGRPRVADDDHEFVSRAHNAAATARPAEELERIVTALRDVKATEPPPEHPEPVTTTEGTDRVAPIRAALQTTQPTTDAPMVRDAADAARRNA